MDRPDRPRDQPPKPRPWSAEDMSARLDRLPPNHPSSPAYRRAAEARARDHPRQADQQPERQRPWYAAHAARENALERQRRDQAPTTDPQRWRDDWYRQRDGDVPAPFREQVAERVPTQQPGTRPGTKGRLDRHDGGHGLPLDSGRKTGLTEALEHRDGRLPPGYTSQNKSHVEAHAAAWMHLNPHIREATLYLNERPCLDKDGCRKRLPTMLPEGTRLTVYAPGEFYRVYYGQRSAQGES
jgi:SCP1.201-like deaminase